MLSSIRNVKFTKMSKLNMFINAVCVLFYFLNMEDFTGNIRRLADWSSLKDWKNLQRSGAPNEDIVQKHLKIALLNVF